MNDFEIKCFNNALNFVKIISIDVNKPMNSYLDTFDIILFYEYRGIIFNDISTFGNFDFNEIRSRVSDVIKHKISIYDRIIFNTDIRNIIMNFEFKNEYYNTIKPIVFDQVFSYYAISNSLGIDNCDFLYSEEIDELIEVSINKHIKYVSNSEELFLCFLNDCNYNPLDIINEIKKNS